ncbi:MAG: hypothetical protein JSU95_14850 [Betaproteobacteria bacterium]|nr:MAG: hypothetical protein JSU95_14850 [Betaproteobacteria bacterium]
MSSSSAPPESKRRSFPLRSLLILFLIAGYPLAAWWIFVHGGTAGTTALWVAALPQAFCYLALLWLFGRSLMAGREALLTRFARFVHGEISAAVETYTRQITVFWCGFFAAMAVVSASLFVFVSADAWLFFANVLNLPLVVGAFVAEYFYRSLRFPNGPYPSLAATVEAFRRFRETIRE